MEGGCNILGPVLSPENEAVLTCPVGWECLAVSHMVKHFAVL